jgi:ribosomal-protein-alanine N-acetyltransferase
MEEQFIPIFTIQDKENNVFFVFPITPKDGWSLCDFVVRNEDRLSEFFPKTKAANLTPDLSNRFAVIKSKEFFQKEEFLFTVKPKDSKKIIGLIYLKELNWTTGQGELAYCIDYTCEGKGITSQLVTKLSDYAFGILHLKTLQIIVHKTNISSVRVAEKSNFTWVKALSKAYTPPGKETLDMELYERYANNS